MVTVSDDPVVVERLLGEGRLLCPGCAGVLAGWGHGRVRVLRSLGGRRVRVRPRRGRCGTCGGTHVLLPVGLLVRRADLAVVVGQALRDRAGGAGVRRVAAGCGRPVETVRGWLRRFGARIVAVGMVFARLLRVLADDPVIPASTGDLWADTLVVIMAGFQAARKRLPGLRVGVWDWVCGVSSGCLLHPGWPPVSINTS